MTVLPDDADRPEAHPYRGLGGGGGALPVRVLVGHLQASQLVQFEGLKSPSPRRHPSAQLDDSRGRDPQRQWHHVTDRITELRRHAHI